MLLSENLSASNYQGAADSLLSSTVRGGIIMVPHLLFYQLLLVALVLIYCMIHGWWPDDPTTTLQTPPKLVKPQRKRSKEPKRLMHILCLIQSGWRRQSPDVPRA